MNLTESERKRQRNGESKEGGGERREKEMRQREREEREGREGERERLAGSIFKPIRVMASKENDTLKLSRVTL